MVTDWKAISMALRVIDCVGCKDVHVDRFFAGEGGGFQIGRELQSVMGGDHRVRQALRRCVAGNSGKKTGNYGRGCESGARGKSKKCRFSSETSRAVMRSGQGNSCRHRMEERDPAARGESSIDAIF